MGWLGGCLVDCWLSSGLGACLAVMCGVWQFGGRCLAATLPTPPSACAGCRCRAPPGAVDTALSYCHYTLNDRSLAA